MKTETRIEILAKHLGTSADNIRQSEYDKEVFECEGKEYLVLTNSEADDRFDIALDDYIENCILSVCPDMVSRYFDRAAWKRDAWYDGRGHSLAGYDGIEHAVHRSEGVYAYIYRIN